MSQYFSFLQLAGCHHRASLLVVKAGSGMADSADKIASDPSQYKAGVWVHFGFKNKPGSMDLDNTNAICKLCHAAIKYSGNTTNLRTHLVRRHAEMTLKEKQPKPGDQKQTTLDNKLPSNSVEKVVENRGLRYMVNTLEPRYVIPTRKHITKVAVPRMYEASCKNISWLSRKSGPYMRRLDIEGD